MTDEEIKHLKTIQYWGASTSSHQVEGKNHNQWSVWELAHARQLADEAPTRFAHWLPRWQDVEAAATDPANYVSGIAVDHYERYEEDFDIAANLHLNALRFSIEWSRIEPEEGVFDEAQIEHYRSVLRSLKRRGLEPFVCLWHWTMPVWFAEKGGFEHKENIRYFVRYVEKVMIEIKDQVTYVITVNEPNVYAGLSYGQGEWPPQATSTFKTMAVYHNLIRAHRRTYKSLKKLKKGLQIGIAQHVTHFYPGNDSLVTKTAVKAKDIGWNWWFFDRTKNSHDFIGVNHYQSNRQVGLRIENPNEKQNDMGWNMEPVKIAQVLIEADRRYKLPLIVTENGVADDRDVYRQWWLEQTFTGIAKAIKAGAKIEGYLHWSLLDNFEWAHGFWPRFGLVEVDRETLSRKVRPSAEWYRDFIQTVR
jgi:beta-glucosidase